MSESEAACLQQAAVVAAVALVVVAAACPQQAGGEEERLWEVANPTEDRVDLLEVDTVTTAAVGPVAQNPVVEVVAYGSQHPALYQTSYP